MQTSDFLPIYDLANTIRSSAHEMIVCVARVREHAFCAQSGEGTCRDLEMSDDRAHQP
jgi:hypothetical protein